MISSDVLRPPVQHETTAMHALFTGQRRIADEEEMGFVPEVGQGLGEPGNTHAKTASL